MYISHFEVSNYKSYRRPAALDLLPGFNVITGQNNAGKTSLLEALSLTFSGLAHRSLQTVPVPGVLPANASAASITLVVMRQELMNLLRSAGGTYYIARPVNSFRFPNGNLFDGTNDSLNQFAEWFLSNQKFALKVRRTILENRVDDDWVSEDSGFGLYAAVPEHQQGTRQFIAFSLSQNGEVVQHGNRNGASSTDLALWLVKMVRPRIYRFFAERFNVGHSATGTSTVLASNAQNLPEVLNILQHNIQRFLHLNQLLHQILPQVQQISVHPIGPSQLEITAWAHDPASQREDLAFPLHQCGSGIGQVAAILYVVLTAVHPQVIIIDEPQSLLHPGAVRKLIEVLKQFPQHQYILSTHSPSVITAANPATVTLAKLTNGETGFQEINTAQAQDVQLYLAEVGARLSDVFGADNVLWVEGQTEELAFPKILSAIRGRSLMGTAIVGIRQTGDLEGRDAKRVFELYRRLSNAASLLPPALGYVLDPECRPAAALDDLKRESHNKAQFLPRRMFENYLLNSGAVASIANGIEGFRTPAISPAEVAERIERKKDDLHYYCAGSRAIPANPNTHVDGARILKEIFSELSENRVTYDKVRHSVALTNWLIENQPNELDEVADFLISVLDS